MAGATHRTKVDGLWVFQLAIPADCREELARRVPEEYQGQKVIRRSLGTANARDAEVKMRENIRPGSNGNIADLITKRWNCWRKRIGLNGQGLCFHSPCHSFKDRCREAGVSEEIHDALTGHAGGGVGRRYGGRPPEGSGRRRREAELPRPHVRASGLKS